METSVNVHLLQIISLKSRLENSNRAIDQLGEKKAAVDKEISSARDNFGVGKMQLENELAITKDQLKVYILMRVHIVLFLYVIA